MLGLAEGLRKAAPATCTAQEGRGGWAGAASSRTCIAHGRQQQQNGGVGGLIGEQVSPTVTGTGARPCPWSRSAHPGDTNETESAEPLSRCTAGSSAEPGPFWNPWSPSTDS